MIKDIMEYESRVWNTADLLLGAGIKQSDFPKFMMPFFALIMVESRLLRMSDEIIEELGIDEDEISSEDFIDYIKEQDKGYNLYLFEHRKTLKDICKNDKNFEIDFDEYLNGFDDETKDLLGINKGNEEEKFLDISGISGQLKKKKIFFAFVKEWSEIDLKPFNNSEITTLEEHIKRRWADISAETAGEQYTPDDVIALISDIVASKVDKDDRFLTIYDPTCGGGNMLFGVEDRINEVLNRPIATYGQDWNDSLYALAKIESRFRENSYIKYGNTLTNMEFYDKRFDVIVANPPYGVDWKGYKNDIINDKTGRFIDFPAVSDGQLLFMQHIISMLDSNGIALVVHNGSTLFTGDAGSGESNIRKWILEEDIVESIIQLPTDEFFNTNIFTYIWVLNKNKDKNREEQILLIDASEKFTLLKKNKGKKRKEIDEASRKDIINTLEKFEENNYAKIYHRDKFFYNKQYILITDNDINGKSIEDMLENNKKSIKIDNVNKVIQFNDGIEDRIEKFIIDRNEIGELESLKEYNSKVIKTFISKFDYKQDTFKVYCNDCIYYFDNEKNTIIKEENGYKHELGCGKISIKSTYKKPTKSKDEFIEIHVEITPEYIKDNEIISFCSDEIKNRDNIESFMKKYVESPFKYLDNAIGVEINFNKYFYKQEEITDTTKIIAQIKKLNDELMLLEKELLM